MKHFDDFQTTLDYITSISSNKRREQALNSRSSGNRTQSFNSRGSARVPTAAAATRQKTVQLGATFLSTKLDGEMKDNCLSGI